MKNSSHEFVIIEKSSVGVYITLKKILSHAVRSNKECIVNNLHELSRMPIKSTKNLNLNFNLTLAHGNVKDSEPLEA